MDIHTPRAPSPRLGGEAPGAWVAAAGTLTSAWGPCLLVLQPGEPWLLGKQRFRSAKRRELPSFPHTLAHGERAVDAWRDQLGGLGPLTGCSETRGHPAGAACEAGVSVSGGRSRALLGKVVPSPRPRPAPGSLILLTDSSSGKLCVFCL